MLMTRFAGKIFEVPSPTAGPQPQLMALPDMTGVAGEGRSGGTGGGGRRGAEQGGGRGVGGGAGGLERGGKGGGGKGRVDIDCGEGGDKYFCSLIKLIIILFCCD